MDTIIIFDFGGQYCHLISRRIKDLGVYAEVLPPQTKREDLGKISRLKGTSLKGIILSGAAASVYDENAPKMDRSIFNLGVPVLGICYGHQLIAYLEKGEVVSGVKGEYGITELTIDAQKLADTPNNLLAGLNKLEKVWMNHKDIVKSLPSNYQVTAATSNSPAAAFADEKNKIYGVQFHPEVSHTENGRQILENFVLKICGAKKEWETTQIIKNIQEEIKQKLKNPNGNHFSGINGRKALIGLSGGVDSSTAAVLVSPVIKDDLTAVYVDTGLMRCQETEFLEQEFAKYHLNLKIIKAEERFFHALKGITELEEKRKTIGKIFIDIFEEIAQQEKAEVLIQGTIYSDRIESGLTQNSATIKSHHNVGGLPQEMKLEVYEPLRDLYKDEVRNIARELGLSENIIHRHVFPGPGLAIRIIGEVTPEKAGIVRKASYIIEEELKKSNLYRQVWMAFAVLLPIKSVGIQGDARSYKFPVVVRIIESKDAMTANFAKIPYEILEKISTRITNEISEVNRVVYDISNKPPATMEWE